MYFKHALKTAHAFSFFENITVYYNPDNLWGFDAPNEGEKVTGDSFRFSGWVDSKKEIKSITCSINDGKYRENALLYTRADVPNATAFLKEKIPTAYLYEGINSIALDVNYTDGTSKTLYKKTIIYQPVNEWGFDSPSNDVTITGDSFRFSGWVNSDKKITSITCSINGGEHRKNANLYTRSDVPEAVAFLHESIPSSYLNEGENSVCLDANFEDGTAKSLEGRIVKYVPVKSWGFDSPKNEARITESTFRFSGWVKTDKEIDSITCSINDGTYRKNANLYTRSDVPEARAFLLEKVSSTYLNKGKNTVSLDINFKDGTSKSIDTRIVYLDADLDIKGDINQDGLLDSKDAILAKRISMKDSTVNISNIDYNAGDFDGNGKITINEARKVKRAISDPSILN